MNSNEKLEYSYDSLSDALAIDIHNSGKYHDTITLDENIIIDINKNEFPLSIEILDVSKMLNIEKDLLKKSSLKDLQVLKNGKKIIMNILITIHTPNIDEIKTPNNYSINEESKELVFEKKISCTL